jgi:hypothetical protein
MTPPSMGLAIGGPSTQIISKMRGSAPSCVSPIVSFGSILDFPSFLASVLHLLISSTKNVECQLFIGMVY